MITNQFNKEGVLMGRKRIVVLFLSFLLCCGFGDNGAFYSKKALSEEKSINTRTVNDNEFLIGSKAILGLSYGDVIRIWGKPTKIKRVVVHFPATVEESYSYILQFDNLDIEMYPEFDKNTPVNKTASFRFDITGKKYDFYGVRPGISLKKYLARVKNKDVFSVKRILMDSKSGNFPFPYEYRTLLTQVKQKNYYAGYDKAVYEQVVIKDIPYGAVMLFQNDVLERIVYGNPNAG